MLALPFKPTYHAMAGNVLVAFVKYAHFLLPVSKGLTARERGVRNFLTFHDSVNNET